MRKHYLFSGLVQGVGFRWVASRAAAMYGVSGFVRNLPDGSVEMEAEGSAAALDRVLDCIRRGRFIEIDSLTEREIPERGDSGFHVAD